MRTLICLFVVVMTAGTATGASAAGAFGITMGTPVARLSVVKHVQGNIYEVRAPVPNPEFESYSVIVRPQTGVCKVLAVGRDHKADAYGSAIQTVFSSFRTALSAKYGRSKDFDFLRAGALWDEPREWSMSVRQNERTLASFWAANQGSTLPADILSIGLQVKASGVDSTYITLGYEFANFEQCMAINEQSSNAGL